MVVEGSHHPQCRCGGGLAGCGWTVCVCPRRGTRRSWRLHPGRSPRAGSWCPPSSCWASAAAGGRPGRSGKARSGALRRRAVPALFKVVVLDQGQRHLPGVLDIDFLSRSGSRGRGKRGEEVRRGPAACVRRRPRLRARQTRRTFSAESLITLEMMLRTSGLWVRSSGAAALCGENSRMDLRLASSTLERRL